MWGKTDRRRSWCSAVIQHHGAFLGLVPPPAILMEKKPSYPNQLVASFKLQSVGDQQDSWISEDAKTAWSS